MKLLVQIKPLSVNRAWQGRRFKTKEYLSYEKEFLLKLPALKIPPSPLEIEYIIGFSSVLSDLGNPEKLITDILCKKYNFNDKDIYKLVLIKKIVKKGEEFIDIRINSYSDNMS